MNKYTCERCNKGFTQKSHYDAHKKRKTPCVNNMINIQYIVDKEVKKTLKKMNIMSNNNSVRYKEMDKDMKTFTEYTNSYIYMKVKLKIG